MSRALLFASDSFALAEIRIDGLTEKKKELDLFSEHGREQKEGGMRRDRRKRRLLLPVRSQNRLQGVDVKDPAHEKEGTVVTLQRPGTPGEVHSSGGSYHKQTVSITSNC